jgi:hypothetical protein
MAPTVQSLSHTAARKAGERGRARIATLPASPEMLARVMSADMTELRPRGDAIGGAPRAASGSDHLSQRSTCNTWT